MSGQGVVFGKRGAPAGRAPPPRREVPSETFLAASEAARAAFVRGDSGSGPEAAPTPAGPAAALDEEADMRRFIGANWAGYRHLYFAMKDAPGLAPSPSLAAAAFSSLWLLYRKRYALGLMVLALQFGGGYAAPDWGALIDLAAAFVFGRYGKAMVVRAGLAAVARIRGERDAPEEARQRIARAGGTTIVAPILGALLAGSLHFAVSRT
jgi:hypothetical protein